MGTSWEGNPIRQHIEKSRGAQDPHAGHQADQRGEYFCYGFQSALCAVHKILVDIAFHQQAESHNIKNNQRNHQIRQEQKNFHRHITYGSLYNVFAKNKKIRQRGKILIRM